MTNQNGSKPIPNSVPALDPAAWLKKKADNIIDDVLPSGLAVRRKKTVDLANLATSGQIPLHLLSELQELQGEDELAEDGKIAVDLEDLFENIERYMGMVDAVFIGALVSPRIGETTDLENDTLALSEFDDEVTDKLYILGEVMEATESLRKFRPEHGGDGTATSPKQSVRATAEQHSGDSG